MHKPQLACDYEESKLKFPLMAGPKVDGVRGLNITGSLVGRSLKPFKNIETTAYFSQPQFIGFDGELHLADQETSPSLCRDTTSAVNSIKGNPPIVWAVFDLVRPDTVHLGYKYRYAMLADLVFKLGDRRIKLMPMCHVYELDELLALEDNWLSQGFEGVIMRDPLGIHKDGRASTRTGSYLRIKRFSDAEARVIRIVEAMQNNNEAKTNELGRTERSSHQGNLKPKGMVGSLECIDLETDEPITVGPGEMTHEDRIRFFENPSLIVDKIITYKSFKHGKKDKPRFPTFKNIRAVEDMEAMA